MMVAVGMLRLFIPVHIIFYYFENNLLSYLYILFIILLIFHRRDEITVDRFWGAPVATEVPLIYHCLGV